MNGVLKNLEQHKYFCEKTSMKVFQKFQEIQS